jgi:class 3 adenylate cyclase
MGICTSYKKPSLIIQSPKRRPLRSMSKLPNIMTSYQKLANILLEGFISIGYDKKIRQINNVAEGLLQYSRGDLIGKNISTIILDDNILEDITEDIELVTIMRKNGQEISVELTITDISTEYLICFKTITDELTLEKEIINKLNNQSILMDALSVTLPRFMIPFVLNKKYDVHFVHSDVVVGFIDIVGYTEMCTTHHMFPLLRYVYQQTDLLCKKYNVLRVEFLGDSAMCASNLGKKIGCTSDTPVDDMINLFFEMINLWKEVSLNIRCGIHMGSAISGFLGSGSLRYRIIGDATNIASRMESHATGGTVKITPQAFGKLKDPFNYIFSQNTENIKGVGLMDTYTIHRSKSVASTPTIRRSRSPAVHPKPIKEYVSGIFDD